MKFFLRRRGSGTRGLSPILQLMATVASLYLVTRDSSAQRALGMDSDFHCCSVNFKTAASNGIQFACIKATALDEGFSNSVFASRMSVAHVAGVYTIPYNRCNPSSNAPMTEAAFFWSWASNSITAGSHNLSPALDVEDGLTGSYISDSGGGISLSGWCNEWYNDVSNYAAAAGIHLQQITYINTGVMCALGSGLHGFLWVADPCCSNNPSGSPYTCGGCGASRAWDGCEPTGAQNWTIWQYAWDELIPGPTEHVDLDSFNGTLAQMVATLGITPAITMTPSTNNLSIRYTGTLLSSTNLAGPFQPVSGATSPYTIPATNARQFYRAMAPP